MFSTINFADPKIKNERKAGRLLASVGVVALTIFLLTPFRPGAHADDTGALLVLAKTVSPQILHRGDTTTFTITIVNNGTASAENVRLHDTLPAQLAFKDTGSSERDWTIGTINAGDTKTISYDATVADDASYGDITSTVVLTANNHNDLRSEVTLSIANPDGPLPATGADGRTLFLFFAGIFVMVFSGYGLRETRRLERASTNTTVTLLPLTATPELL